MMNGKPLHPSIGHGSGPCFPGRYSPTYRAAGDPMRRCMPNPPSNLFGGLDDGLLSRAEALAAVDISKHAGPGGQGLPLKHDMMYHHSSMSTAHPSSNNRPHHQMSHHSMETMDLLDPLGSTAAAMAPSLGQMGSDPSGMAGVGVTHSHSHTHQLHAPVYTHSMNTMVGAALGSHPPVGMHAAAAVAAAAAAAADAETDPRELEAFAERFKQRRIKLGVTQADVGRALANLKLPGVGALSQSTICRFESLTLSHNNMIALKPVLQAWLEEAETQARNKRKDPDAPDVLPSGEKKRKRTSIAAPEKRSLEAYFAVQPRPSGEKIAAIAEKLDLKKNVVRVWFCNQRQKQKRMKFSANQH